MTNYLNQSFAAVAALVLAVGLWAPTVAPVDAATTTVAMIATPEMA